MAVAGVIVYTAFYVLSTGNHLWEFQQLPEQLRTLMDTGLALVNPAQKDIGRFLMWQVAISKLCQHWSLMIFGFGPGAFWGRQYPIHGEYISVWFQWGLVGLAIVAGYIIHTWRFLIKRKDMLLTTSFLIICLDCIGNFPMQIASTGFLALIIMGLIERERLKDE